MLLQRDLEHINSFISTLDKTLLQLLRPAPGALLGPRYTEDLLSQCWSSCEKALAPVAASLEQWEERSCAVRLSQLNKELQTRFLQAKHQCTSASGDLDHERFTASSLALLMELLTSARARAGLLWRLRPLSEELGHYFRERDENDWISRGWTVALYVARREEFSATRELWRLVRHELDELHGIRLLPYRPVSDVKGSRIRCEFSDGRQLVRPTEHVGRLVNEHGESLPSQPTPGETHVIGYFFVPNRPGEHFGVRRQVLNSLLRLAWSLSTLPYARRERGRDDDSNSFASLLAACPAELRYHESEGTNDESRIWVTEHDAMFSLLERWVGDVSLRNCLIVHPEMLQGVQPLDEWFAPWLRIPADHVKRLKGLQLGSSAASDSAAPMRSLSVAGPFTARPGDTMRVEAARSVLAPRRRAPSRLALNEPAPVLCIVGGQRPRSKPIATLEAGLLDYSPYGCRVRWTVSSRTEAERWIESLNKAKERNVRVSIQFQAELPWPWSRPRSNATAMPPKKLEMFLAEIKLAKSNELEVSMGRHDGK